MLSSVYDATLVLYNTAVAAVLLILRCSCCGVVQHSCTSSAACTCCRRDEAFEKSIVFEGRTICTDPQLTLLMLACPLLAAAACRHPCSASQRSGYTTCKHADCCSSCSHTAAAVAGWLPYCLVQFLSSLAQYNTVCNKMLLQQFREIRQKFVSCLLDACCLDADTATGYATCRQAENCRNTSETAGWLAYCMRLHGIINTLAAYLGQQQ